MLSERGWAAQYVPIVGSMYAREVLAARVLWCRNLRLSGGSREVPGFTRLVVTVGVQRCHQRRRAPL